MMTIYPTMNLKSSNQLGPAGYNVDDSTNLMKSKLTNTNCKISLQERSYLTVPYLGKGNIDVGLENSLKFGDNVNLNSPYIGVNKIQLSLIAKTFFSGQ